MVSVNDFFDEYEIMGWVAEWRFSTSIDKQQCKWKGYWNHKLYETEKAAMQAMEGKDKMFYKTEIRYRPVYAKKII